VVTSQQYVAFGLGDSSNSSWFGSLYLHHLQVWKLKNNRGRFGDLLWLFHCGNV